MTDFDRAYRENAELVYRYVFSLTRNADLAEEVTQQTFYAAIRHPGNYRGEAALSTYLCGIAGNLMKKEFARRAKENHVPIEDMADLLIVSKVEVTVGGELAVSVSEAAGTKCPRCWKHSTEADENGLCPRCASVIAKCADFGEV